MQNAFRGRGISRRAAIGVMTGVLVAVGLSACGSDDDGGKLTEKMLNFTERETDDFAFIDNAPRTKLGEQGPEELSNGDQLAFRSLMIGAGNKSVGALDATCLITAANGGRFDQASSTCHATVTIPGGQLFLSVGGKPFATDTTRGAVTGGNGDYEGATGSFTSVGEETSKDTFHIWVPEK